MNNKLRMTIVGHGFVGKAIDYAFQHNVEKKIIDPIYGSSIDSTKKLEEDVTFVCVPTPMGEDGKIDASILIDTMKKIKRRMTGLIVIKSTVTPDILDKIITDNVKGRIVYAPEFLTEKNANQDIVNPRMHVFGGNKEATDELARIYYEYSMVNVNVPVYHMTVADASFIKYGLNCYLASKVLWFNQFKELVNDRGGNADKVISIMSTDERINSSHTRTPGYDGKLGFGGACFPKDTRAFNSYAQSKPGRQQFPILDFVIEENDIYRSLYELDDREKAQNVQYNMSGEVALVNER
jgi:UDPglucose 6-dehydrogenase